MKVLVAFGILGLISISRQAPSSPPPTTEKSEDCPTNHSSPRTFQHPTSCSKYLQCANGTKLEMECPIGQHYNKILQVCDSPRFANCKLSPDESSTATSSNIVTASGHNTTTVPSNIVPVHVSTEANGNTTKSEDIKDINKSKEQVTTENSSGKPSEKNETATTKLETSSQESVDKDSGKQNGTTTTPTDLNKRSNETAKGEGTTPSTKDASSARTDINSTTPAGASVSTDQIKVIDKTEPTTDEDSSEKEEDKNTTEKIDTKSVSAEAKHDSAEKLGNTKSSSAESKPETSTEGIKKEESSTAKAGDSKEVTNTTQITPSDGKATSRNMEPKEMTKTDNNTSKEKAQPELGGEEERKKDDGKKPLEDTNKKVGS